MKSAINRQVATSKIKRKDKHVMDDKQMNYDIEGI